MGLTDKIKNIGKAVMVTSLFGGAIVMQLHRNYQIEKRIEEYTKLCNSPLVAMDLNCQNLEQVCEDEGFPNFDMYLRKVVDDNNLEIDEKGNILFPKDI